jgi:hypothetical protein
MALWGNNMLNYCNIVGLFSYLAIWCKMNYTAVFW